MEEDIVIGRHVYGNLYDVSEDRVFTDEEYVRNLVIEAARVANAKLLAVHSWKVGGKKGGISVLALVVESHIAIHSWTEYRYVTVDIYTCGKEADPWKAFNYILNTLKPKDYIVHYADRSSKKTIKSSEVKQSSS